MASSPKHRLSFAGDDVLASSAPVSEAPAARRSLMKVQRKTKRTKSNEGYRARTDSPAKLYATINPQYTYERACEIYGGEPRPLTARHIFIRNAFLADTEDWRTNAYVGDSRSPIARMNITDPDKCMYLKKAAMRRMSFSRQRSLAKAISFRQTLVKRDGSLAETQYTDQYLGKETVMATVRRQHSKRSSSLKPANAEVTDALKRSFGGEPNRVLASFVSRGARPASAPATQAKQLSVHDKGLSRALSRIMTRTRTVRISTLGGDVAPGSSDESVEECPRMEDI